MRLYRFIKTDSEIDVMIVTDEITAATPIV